MSKITTVAQIRSALSSGPDVSLTPERQQVVNDVIEVRRTTVTEGYTDNRSSCSHLAQAWICSSAPSTRTATLRTLFPSATVMASSVLRFVDTLSLYPLLTAVLVVGDGTLSDDRRTGAC